MPNLWQLPNELLITSISANFPGREAQIRILTTLLCPAFPTPQNVVLYGPEATGKSTLTKAILEKLSTAPEEESSTESPELRFTIVKSAECITGRQLLERTLGAVARALHRKDYSSRCENLAQLVVELGKLLRDEDDGLSGYGRRFMLVFDGIDKQRDAPGTLLPALARMGEFIPNLTTIFVVTHPRPNFLHTSGVPHIHFQNYTKAQAIKILSSKPGVLFPPESRSSSASEEDEQELEKARQQETLEIWSKFCSSVWDSLSKYTDRDIPTFRHLCNRLWDPFIQPLLQGTYTTKQFSKLFLAQRHLFQNEKFLVPNICVDSSLLSTSINTTQQQKSITSSGIETQLPYYSRLLLIAAYLCSHNHPRTDVQHFSHTSTAKRRKKGGGTALAPTSRKPGIVKHRKISRRLIGAQGFVLERWLAVFWAMCDESNGVGKTSGGKLARTADIEMGISTLGSLRLVVRMGGAGERGDLLDRAGKWRVLVGWEGVRGVARSVGVEMEDFLGE